MGKIRLILVLGAFGVLGTAQTVINGSREVVGALRVDGTTATVESGASLPSTCTAGPPADVFLRTSDHTLHYCSATDTWTQMAGGGSGGGSMLDMKPQQSAVTVADGRSTLWTYTLTGGTLGAGECLRTIAKFHKVSGGNYTPRWYFGASEIHATYLATGLSQQTTWYVCNDPGSTTSQQGSTYRFYDKAIALGTTTEATASDVVMTFKATATNGDQHQLDFLLLEHIQ